MCRADEPERLPGQDRRRVVPGTAPVVDETAALVERVPVVALLRHAVHRHPPVPPGWDAVVPVERVAVQVLADQGGRVAGVVEPGGERRAIVEARVPVRPEVRDHARVVRVLPREDARAGRAALRCGGVVPVEAHALAGQQALDVAHAAVRVDPFVVGDDHDDVQASRSGRGGAARVTRDPEREAERRGDHRPQSPPPHARHRSEVPGAARRSESRTGGPSTPVAMVRPPRKGGGRVSDSCSTGSGGTSG